MQQAAGAGEAMSGEGQAGPAKAAASPNNAPEAGAGAVGQPRPRMRPPVVAGDEAI